MGFDYYINNYGFLLMDILLQVNYVLNVFFFYQEYIHLC